MAMNFLISYKIRPFFWQDGRLLASQRGPKLCAEQPHLTSNAPPAVGEEEWCDFELIFNLCFYLLSSLEASKCFCSKRQFSVLFPPLMIPWQWFFIYIPPTLKNSITGFKLIKRDLIMDESNRLHCGVGGPLSRLPLKLAIAAKNLSLCSL
jgi:hypothetical protein